MEGESKTTHTQGGDLETEPPQENHDMVFNNGNVLQPSGFRCPFCSGDEMDRVLLGYGRNFLLPFGLLLWAIFLLS
jgi:hypothetical protein